MANRLIKETSPYLLQHAHNPVDWYPWGPEALDAARTQDKPILLSVGYSACHWCHVMERECFENIDIANLMNQNFICIKVDREERPDVDSIYMSAVQAMTGSGGWPMTVFLTPDSKPFYGGTYFPPEDRGGLPAFPRVLTALAAAYKDDRSEVIANTGRLLGQMEKMSITSTSTEPLAITTMETAYEGLKSNFDNKHGGTGLQPKFPQPMTYEFLLRYHLATGDHKALEMVEITLDKMALGGIYDQLGGGFHRYSTDNIWLVPHFEKMLYDNALLVKLYLHAYQVTRKPLYRKVVEETLDYVTREMTGPDGEFYSAQDADTEGVEGKYFVWRPEEIIEILGKDNGELVNRYFSVTKRGNFEGHSILYVNSEISEFARKAGMDPDNLIKLLDRAKDDLLKARRKRTIPGLDDKALTAWNGLMLSAFAEAGSILSNQSYVYTANRSAEFILQNLVRDGRVLRTYKNEESKLNGYLEDYAFLIQGLISAHEATFNGNLLREAVNLAEGMLNLFWSEIDGQFYDTGHDHEDMVVRPRDVTDNAIPSGNSMATDVLLKLSVITGNEELGKHAEKALRGSRELMERIPSGAGHWLCALDYYLSTPKEIAIIGYYESEDTNALLKEVFSHYLPNRILICSDPRENTITDMPLVLDKVMLNKNATAYVCQNYACEMPVSKPELLASQLST